MRSLVAAAQLALFCLFGAGGCVERQADVGFGQQANASDFSCNENGLSPVRSTSLAVAVVLGIALLKRRQRARARPVTRPTRSSSPR